MSMPFDVAIDVRDDVPPAEAAVVDAGLDAHNVASAPLDDVQPVSCFARLASGEVIGGAVGRTWGRSCELRQIWVAEAHRGRGLGTRLLRAFEARAAERGCGTFYLETWTFQARGFYEALGYEVRLAIEGHAPGIAKFVMMRDDVAGRGSAPTIDGGPEG
jgi:ribosomal protein S18 acetylase RimI-like enzyme